MAKVSIVEARFAKDEVEIKEAVAEAVDLIGGFSKHIKKGESVLIKPNYNSDDLPPASTDPLVVKAVVELLREAGAGKIAIGESSGPMWKPTMRVLEKMGLNRVADEAGVEVLDFDNLKMAYRPMPSGARLLKGLHLPESLDHYDRLVYVCCLKTHLNARFTLSLKLAMGFPKMHERFKMHAWKLEEKIAELNLLVKPDLIIMDGRKCFVTGGPAAGHVREPGVFLASTDRVAIDIEGVKILQSYRVKNMLDRPPQELPLIKEAIRLGIGNEGEVVRR